MTEIAAFIFARGGSKGLVNKNRLEFAGKPLIAWAIGQALENSRIRRLIVSTDSLEIASIAREYGAEVPFLRPQELASDTSSELNSWKHAIRFLSDEEGYFPEIFLSLPCTAPLRTQADIDSNLDTLINNNADLAISATPSIRSPYFNMIQVSDAGAVSPLMKSDTQYVRRQDAPHTYDITPVAYSARPGYILETNQLFSGKVYANIVSRENAVDIDDFMDFQFAEMLFKKRNNES